MPITNPVQCLAILEQEAYAFNVPRELAEEYTQQLARQGFVIQGRPIENVAGLFRRWLEKVKRQAVAPDHDKRKAEYGRLRAQGINPFQSRRREHEQTDPEGYTSRRADPVTNSPESIGQMLRKLGIDATA